MGRHATPITLTAEGRAELERRVRARTSAQQVVLRAQIVLRAADGAQNQVIAAELGIVRHTVQHWRDRFAAQGLDGLRDRPHCPPARLYGPAIQAQIVVLACQAPAALGWAGQTHWSIGDLTQYIAEHPDLELGTPSRTTVGTILQAANLRLDRL